ncbi:MAG TPA: DUF6677 family protein [Candidatus Acidoferrales bacterium]|nr:DUF6677 family protein [Candidatus Acidoferrales bacterium]
MQEEHSIGTTSGEPPLEIPPPVPQDVPGTVPAEEFSEPSDLPPPLEPQTPSPRRPTFGDRVKRGLLALIVAAIGWAIPGAGHLVLRRWGRAAVGFAAVALLAVVGMKMRGNVFPYHGNEPFDVLGFVADASSGVFYLLTKTVEAAGPDVAHASGDYGTRMIAAAGILNLLLLIDASEIASGQKS